VVRRKPRPAGRARIPAGVGSLLHKAPAGRSGCGPGRWSSPPLVARPPAGGRAGSWPDATV